MAIKQLTAEQVATMSRVEKDRYWLENVYRKGMPQLTLRAAVTGFFLGGILSLTNLYVGAKTGWTLGVGITSVILAFAMFKALTQVGFRDMTILESNCMQSVATAAGYMTGPLVSGIAAYMMIENRLLPFWQVFFLQVVLSVLGVLVAFPMKRRFINDEQQPFPEGQACGVVLDTLYTAEAKVGLFKAKALAITAGSAGLLKFITGESLMRLVQVKALGLKKFWYLPESIDEIAYRWLVTPRITGVPIDQLGLSLSLDMAMFGAGGLMGIRAATSMFLGMLLNYVLIAPIMIAAGEIPPLANGDFSARHILTRWSLWWGVTIMVVASLVALFAKPKMILSAFDGLRRKKPGAVVEDDPVAHIELPLSWSLIGVPIVGLIGVWMIHDWFGVAWGYGLLAIPLIIALTMIAANSTALTGITPTGSLSKIPQFLFGSMNPQHPATNLMPALMCTEVASNASNLLMDIKPGYMLGANPRQQAAGHLIGIVAGTLASTPLFYLLFLSGYTDGGNVQEVMVTKEFGFPSALQWKGVSELVQAVFAGGGSAIPSSAVYAVMIAAVAGLAFEGLRIGTKNRFPISAIGLGLGVVLPPDSTLAMFAGAAFFWWMRRRHAQRTGTLAHRLFIETHEPICAGLIAGAALIGIADVLVKVFVFGK